ncbi:MAG: phosphosulfolactate synthase [Firmicutes bacterium]|nr:phosphosulfolactate synthase [Bacillota bacterium]
MTAPVKNGSCNIWQGLIDFPLPGRSQKPRRDGLTMVIDKGLGLAGTRDLMRLAAGYIDMIKLGFGTTALYKTEILQEKIQVVQSYGIDVFPGGTFLEVAVLQEKIEEYILLAKKVGFTAIEVSDGTIDLTDRLRRRAISFAAGLGLKVFTEVGKKEPGNELCFKDLMRLVKRDLQSGATRVIVEGRDPAKDVGLYDSEGRLIEFELRELVAAVSDTSVLIWEAPEKEQQQDLIRRFGPNVNIGNVNPRDVIALEALRAGLRSDTLKTAVLTQ